MNIYSQGDQQYESQDEQSQISWSQIHKSSIEIKSKKICKRQPQEIQKKWFSLRKISSCRQDLQEKKDIDLRDQKNYDFDYLQLDQDLLSNKNPILVSMIYNQAVDKISGRTLVVKVAQLESEIIEKLFNLDYHNIIAPENLYTYCVQSHKIDDLAKEIKIVNVSFSLLLFEYCPISLKQKCDDLKNKQIKTIFLDLIQGLISARKANLSLKNLSIDSILYSEDKSGFKLQDFTDAIIGNNTQNMKDLGRCLISILKRKKNDDNSMINLAQEMINSEKPFEEFLEKLQKFE